MGTRGYVVIVFNGKVIAVYNHWDSYVTGLGYELIKELAALMKLYTLEQLRGLFSKVIVNGEPDSDSSEEIEDTTTFLEQMLKSGHVVNGEPDSESSEEIEDTATFLEQMLKSGHVVASEYKSVHAFCRKVVFRDRDQIFIDTHKDGSITDYYAYDRNCCIEYTYIINLDRDCFYGFSGPELMHDSVFTITKLDENSISNMEENCLSESENSEEESPIKARQCISTKRLEEKMGL